MDWSRLIPLYWVSLGLHSVFAAVLLALIGLPASATVKPVWQHFARQKARLLIFGPFVVWAFWRFGIYAAMIWISVAVVSTELYDRHHGDLWAITTWISPAILPAIYFFLGLILVFAYDDAIAALKDPSAYDWVFLRMDSYLLHGRSISDFVRQASSSLSPRVFALAETVYYRMFDQMGAAILLVSVCQGLKRGLRLVGSMLSAYYISLLVFYLWPSMGPFYTSPDHFTYFPHWLQTYQFQQNLIANAKVLSGPLKGLVRISANSFFAFPSLHIALPLVVLWFMRPWKRIFYALAAYDVVLVPAILLLEWHYVVDLVGGVIVAAIALLINEFPQSLNAGRRILLREKSAQIEQPDSVCVD
ncbi:MAG TPA: phosphatase PAP2 family protein [Terriglobales bacterium]|nr:phosphatase PAP2 family protein [Terriglobales bacterium]